MGINIERVARKIEEERQETKTYANRLRMQGSPIATIQFEEGKAWGLEIAGKIIKRAREKEQEEEQGR